MSGFRLHDWNDIRLIIECARCGRFARAAQVLGIDQRTVSRRIGTIEKQVGRPLFHRYRSGATPTVPGLVVLNSALVTEQSVHDLEAVLTGINTIPPQMATLAASEGLLGYTLIPVLLGNMTDKQPLNGGLIRNPLPPLNFTSDSTKADVAVISTSKGELPKVAGNYRVSLLGTMHFRPLVGKRFLSAQRLQISSFDQLADYPLLDIGMYGKVGSLAPWNALVEHRSTRQEVKTSTTTRMMHEDLVMGEGIGILPGYSPIYDGRGIVLDIKAPSLNVSLWIVAHEDKLREPSIRTLFNTMVVLFRESPWYGRHDMAA